MTSWSLHDTEKSKKNSKKKESKLPLLNFASYFFLAKPSIQTNPTFPNKLWKGLFIIFSIRQRDQWRCHPLIFSCTTWPPSAPQKKDNLKGFVCVALCVCASVDRCTKGPWQIQLSHLAEDQSPKENMSDWSIVGGVTRESTQGAVGRMYLFNHRSQATLDPLSTWKGDPRGYARAFGKS
jgi:hypothetical protein